MISSKSVASVPVVAKYYLLVTRLIFSEITSSEVIDSVLAVVRRFLAPVDG